jgi:hypothetical protein
MTRLGWVGGGGDRDGTRSGSWVDGRCRVRRADRTLLLRQLRGSRRCQTHLPLPLPSVGRVPPVAQGRAADARRVGWARGQGSLPHGVVAPIDGLSRPAAPYSVDRAATGHRAEGVAATGLGAVWRALARRGTSGQDRGQLGPDWGHDHCEGWERGGICRSTCGGSNGALWEQATSGREAGFRVESRGLRGCRVRRRGRRPVDRRVGGTKETTSNTPDRRGSGRYANSPRTGHQRERRGSSVRGAPGHGVGEDAVMNPTATRELNCRVRRYI